MATVSTPCRPATRRCSAACRGCALPWQCIATDGPALTVLEHSAAHRLDAAAQLADRLPCSSTCCPCTRCRLVTACLAAPYTGRPSMRNCSTRSVYATGAAQPHAYAAYAREGSMSASAHLRRHELALVHDGLRGQRRDVGMAVVVPLPQQLALHQLAQHIELRAAPSSLYSTALSLCSSASHMLYINLTSAALIPYGSR